jgi:hypothetical protein
MVTLVPTDNAWPDAIAVSEDKVQASEMFQRPTGQRANSVVLTSARIGLTHHSHLLARTL